MAVDDVGLEVQHGQGVQAGAAEEAEALVLIAAHAVDVAAAEIIFIVHEPEGHSAVHQFLDAAVLLAPAQVDLEIHLVAHLLLIFLGDLGVQGQHHLHIMTGFRQHGGEGAHHIGQAACFDERNAFRGGKQYLHTINLHRGSFYIPRRKPASAFPAALIIAEREVSVNHRVFAPAFSAPGKELYKSRFYMSLSVRAVVIVFTLCYTVSRQNEDLRAGG